MTTVAQANSKLVDRIEEELTSPPKSRERSILSPLMAPTGAPAMAAALYSGNMIACSGQTRLHAGQPLRQLSGCSTRFGRMAAPRVG